jgi:hypothetical protein
MGGLLLLRRIQRRVFDSSALKLCDTIRAFGKWDANGSVCVTWRLLGAHACYLYIRTPLQVSDVERDNGCVPFSKASFVKGVLGWTIYPCIILSRELRAYSILGLLDVNSYVYEFTSLSCKQLSSRMHVFGAR